MKRPLLHISHDFSPDPVHLSQSANLPFSSKHEALRFLLSCTDHTILGDLDTPRQVERHCDHVLFPSESITPPVFPASVCTYPVFIPVVSQRLLDSPIKVCSVAGAFPSGQSPLEIRLKEAEYALKNGADEIDMVISRGRLLARDYQYVQNEIGRFRSITGKATLKVILETSQLQKPDHIVKAAEIALHQGADFLKTSTGKGPRGAEPGPFLIMCECLKQWAEITGQRKGIKVSGGISHLETALFYMKLTCAHLGPQWLCKDLFRIGSSKLAGNILQLLAA